MEEANKLGLRVKAYRERLGISQEELATRAGLDVEFIKDVESGNVYPAVGMLVKISRALGKRLGTFTDDIEVKDPLITKASKRIEEGSSPEKSHYHYFPLGKGKTDRNMEPLFIRIDPKCGEPLSAHEGEEFIMVLTGRIELTYGKAKHLLGPGDSVYYNSLIPHKVSAADDRPAEIFAMIYVPF
ncbi:MAG: cupin domain-containing protein [Methanomassiliicoccaceae archaeon]|nr:cupin domain-containing protein [Methanomassiliicoccaceae archaeon]